MIITCSQCGAKNRVDISKSGHPKCGRCKNPLDARGGGGPLELNDDGFADFIKSAEKPVLVDFWASWCGPCRMMAPVLEEFASTQDKIIVAKMDVEKNQQTPPLFNIYAIPTLILFEGGSEVHRITSAVSMDVLSAQLGRWL